MRVVLGACVVLAVACGGEPPDSLDASDASHDAVDALHDGGTPDPTCAVPEGAHESVGRGMPLTGLRCIRYPAVAVAPRDVLVTADGRILVSEMGGGRILRFEGDETFSTVADGLRSPIGLRELPDGDLIVAEENIQSVSRVDPTTGERALVAERLRNTTYLTLGPGGAAYVSGFAGGSSLVWRIDVETGEATEYATGLRLAEGLFFEPDGSLVVAELDLPSAVMRYPPGGGSSARSIATGFTHIYGLLRDRDGGILVADQAGRIVRVAPDGMQEVLLEGIGRPGGMAWSPEGDLLIAEFVDFGTAGYLIRLTGF